MASFGLEYVQTWLMQLTGQRIMYDLRMQIYAHLQRLDLQFYDRNPVGRLMTRVTSDVDVLNELFTAGVVAVFGDIFTLAGIMIVMLGMDWQLALASFVVLPLIALVTQWFRAQRARVLPHRAHAGSPASTPSCRRTSRACRRCSCSAGSRRTPPVRPDQRATHRDANIDSIFYYAVFYPAIELVGALAASIIIWYGGCGCWTATLTLGVLVAFLQYSARFFRPISDMSEKFNVLQSAMASSERIFTLLDTPVDDRRVRRSPYACPRRSRGHIVFDHVWFAYKGEDWVLRDVSFEVRPGERVAIVGATGLGQDDDHQPAAALLRRAARAHPGRRRRHPRAGSRPTLRGLFGLVLQDVHLFSGTLGGNIRLGDDAHRRRRRSGARPTAVRADRVHRARCRAASTRRSPSGARRCRRGRSSCCRSRARWRSTAAS